MKNERIHLFNSLLDKQSSRTISLQEFITGGPKEQIVRLRDLNSFSSEFQKRKKELPAVIFNALTNGGGKDSDIIALKNILFLDVDKVAPEDFDALRTQILRLFPSTLLMWRSCSGHGLGILLHTKGVTLENWDSLRDHFAGYDLGKYAFDGKCFTKTRKNFWSFDEDAYINWNAPALDLSSLVSKEKETKEEGRTKKVQPSPRLTSSLGLGLNCTFSLRFNNISDFFQGEHEGAATRFFPEGIDIIQTERSWRKVKSGDRNQFLFRNLVRILHLNPVLSESELTSLGHTLNQRCEEPLSNQEIAITAAKVFSNRYQAFPNKKRKLLFNPAIKRTTRDKQSETQRILQRAKGDATQQQIYDFIESYDGTEKLTGTMISKELGISLRTFRTYGKTFKDLIKHNNEQLKQKTQQMISKHHTAQEEEKKEIRSMDFHPISSMDRTSVLPMEETSTSTKSSYLESTKKEFIFCFSPLFISQAEKTTNNGQATSRNDQLLHRPSHQQGRQARCDHNKL